MENTLYSQKESETALEDISRTLTESSIPILDTEAISNRNKILLLSSLLILYNLGFVSLLQNKLKMFDADFSVKPETIKYIGLFSLLFFFISFLLSCIRSWMKWNIRRRISLQKMTKILSNLQFEMQNLSSVQKTIERDRDTHIDEIGVMNKKIDELGSLRSSIMKSTVNALDKYAKAPDRISDNLGEEEADIFSSMIYSRPNLYPFLLREVEKVFPNNFSFLEKEETTILKQKLLFRLKEFSEIFQPNIKFGSEKSSESLLSNVEFEQLIQKIFQEFEKILRENSQIIWKRNIGDFEASYQKFKDAENTSMLAITAMKYVAISLKTSFTWELLIPAALCSIAFYTSLP